MDFHALTSNRVVRLTKETLENWMEDSALRLSAALAYYSVFSIAPLLIIAISVAGLVLGQEAVRGEVGETLKGYVGAKAAQGVESMVESASKPAESWAGTAVGFLTLLVGASGVFGQLKDALNTIWEVKARKGVGFLGLVKDRLWNFGMVLIIGFLLLVSLLLSTALAAVTGRFGNAVGFSPAIAAVFGFVVSVGMATVLFALIFKVLPDVYVEWRNVWTGALVTALLFELGKFGLSYYLGRESAGSSYGAAGSVVLLLLWVYYASCILLFGAEFTQVYARDRGHAIVPVPGAEPATAGQRAQEGLTPETVHEPAPATAPLPPAPEVVWIEPREAPQKPLLSLLVVTVVSFLVGLWARRTD